MVQKRRKQGWLHILWVMFFCVTSYLLWRKKNKQLSKQLSKELSTEMFSFNNFSRTCPLLWQWIGICSLVSYMAVSAAHTAERLWCVWHERELGRRESLVVEGGQAAPAAEILLGFLTVHWTLDSILRSTYHPNRMTKHTWEWRGTVWMEVSFKGMCRSLEAEVTGLQNPVELVKLQKAGSGTKYICMALSLINSLSVTQCHCAVWAIDRQINTGHGNRSNCRVFHYGEQWFNLCLCVQFLWKNMQNSINFRLIIRKPSI